VHGFNQGWPTIAELIDQFDFIVILLQEHWLTPTNLIKFDELFNEYFTFGNSAMAEAVESDVLRGRPFGGIMCLINNDLREFSQNIYCNDRCAIIRLLNYLIVNVYFPCSGSTNRVEICLDLIADIESWCDQYASCDLIVAGDFNVDLDSSEPTSTAINNFLIRHRAVKSDNLFLSSKTATYINDALGHLSAIDYVVTSAPNGLIDYAVIDPDVNFSDHLPIMATFHVNSEVILNTVNSKKSVEPCMLQYRWDKADTVAYYFNTGALLQPILTSLESTILMKSNNCNTDIGLCIENVYQEVINILTSCANSYVPFLTHILFFDCRHY
jgi:exonuclease III